MDNEIIPATESETAADKLVDLGKWIGRHQALAWVVSHCSAADAHSLLTIRERKLYRALGLTWEEFCLQHAGISARTAERIIASLKEFGDSYFNLTEIVQIPVTAYRALQPAIEDNALEFEGQRIPINRENTQKLAEAVQKLRARLEKAEQRPSRCAMSDLQAQLDRAVGQLSGILRRDADRERELVGIMVQEHIGRMIDALQEAGYKVLLQQPDSKAA